MEVCDAGCPGGRTCRVAELNVRIFLGGLHHVGLMTEGVCEDDVAALVGKVDSRIIAGLILGDIRLLDDLVGGEAEGLRHLLDAVHVGFRVAFVLIADIDDADLDLVCGDAGTCGSRIGGRRVRG